MTSSLFHFSKVAVVERRSGTSELGSFNIQDLRGELIVTSVPLKKLSICFINEFNPNYMFYKCLLFQGRHQASQMSSILMSAPP
jgi:hypothetical protein